MSGLLPTPLRAALLVLACVVVLPLAAQKSGGGPKPGGGGSHPAPDRQPPHAERGPAGGSDKTRDGEPIERFQRMTPGEQRRALDKLPAERRRAIEQRLDRYNRLSPDEKARLRKFSQLPPERQQDVRQAIDNLTKLSGDRQKAVREELRQMEALTPDARLERRKSPEFRQRFSKQEQKMMERLLEVVPD